MERFYIIEYQDWDKNGNPVYETYQEYLDIATGKAIIYRNKEKAKTEAKRLSSLTRTFNLNSLSYSIEKSRIKNFLIVD